MNKLLTTEDIQKMSYVELLANIKEINRPPGGKDSIRRIVQNSFITKGSRVLDVGCNTGYSTFEISHIAGCNVIGVDISDDMIRTANELRKSDTHKKSTKFQVADGMNLPFKDGMFDLTMSGGSTAFIPDKKKALQEYARVTKVWGFVADINFYYKKKAPEDLITKLNKLMEINIEPWEKEYWTDIYSEVGLEPYYSYTNDVHVPSGSEIDKYCEVMSADIHADKEAKLLIKERLTEIMELFAENHKYLEYGVFVMRKRDQEEQINLFGS